MALALGPDAEWSHRRGRGHGNRHFRLVLGLLLQGPSAGSSVAYDQGVELCGGDEGRKSEQWFQDPDINPHPGMMTAKVNRAQIELLIVFLAKRPRARRQAF